MNAVSYAGDLSYADDFYLRSGDTYEGQFDLLIIACVRKVQMMMHDTRLHHT